MELVEVIPLEPFVGSYKCSLNDDYDTIDDALEEKEGVIMKVKVPRKRYRGVVARDRIASPDELVMAKNGSLPKHVELIGQRILRIYPEERFVRVPPNVADDLVRRKLAAYAGSGGPTEAA